MKKLLLLLPLLLLTTINLKSQVLFKIEGNGLSRPSYIIGTHHLAGMSFLDKLPGLQTMFDATEQMSGEVDLTGNQMETAMKMQKYMMAPQDSTLSKILSPEDYARINTEFKKYSPVPGGDLSMFEIMKPMVISTLVSVQIVKDQLPESAESGQLDTYFQKLAQENGKKIVPLETVEQQAELLYNSIPISQQAEELVKLLDKPEELVESAKKLNESYYDMNLNQLLELSKADNSNPAFMEKLLDERNSAWLSKLPGIMESAPTFFAVGALHLVGENGIIEGLKKKGYILTPME